MSPQKSARLVFFRAACILIAALLSTNSALAHPGHDHDGFRKPGELSGCAEVIRTKRKLSELQLAFRISQRKKYGVSIRAALTAIPLLHSKPSATAKLYLDFDGAPVEAWAGAATPAYDRDGDPTTFSQSELDSIYEVWARVAEKFSPFNLDVTTENPGNQSAGLTQRAVIGGDCAWFGRPIGGVSYVGVFGRATYADYMRTSYVCPARLGNGYPKYVGEAIAHETGHAFGLQHQSTYSGATKTNEYNPGTTAIAPIMGNSYGSSRGLWWYGTNSINASTFQDDLAIVSAIGSNKNNFGYRADDHSSSIGSATPLIVSGSSVSGSGVIAQLSDDDAFSFTTGAGTVTFTLSTATYGPTFDAVLTLKNASGTTLAQAAPTNSLGAALSTTLAAGTYFLDVSSAGNNPGDIGAYAISGTIVPDSSPPTPVPTATATQVPTSTATPVPTFTPTSVPTVDGTETPNPTPISTNTPDATRTPTPVPTTEPSATATPISTATPTPVPTEVPSNATVQIVSPRSGSIIRTSSITVTLDFIGVRVVDLFRDGTRLWQRTLSASASRTMSRVRLSIRAPRGTFGLQLQGTTASGARVTSSVILRGTVGAASRRVNRMKFGEVPR